MNFVISQPHCSPMTNYSNQVDNTSASKSYWTSMRNKITKSFGYAKLEDETISTANDVFIELSPTCPKTAINNNVANSDETLGVDVKKHILSDESNGEILKTSKDLVWHQKHKGLIFMVLATLMGCFLNISVKAISKSAEKLPVLELVIIRGILGSLITLSMMYFQKVDSWMGPADAIQLLLLRGLFAFLGLSFNLFALFSLSVGDATILSFSAPVLTGFLGSIILKEKWERVDQLAGFFSIIGVIFIARPPILFGPVSHQDGAIDDSIMLPDARSIPAIVFESENSDNSLNSTYLNNNTLPIGYTNQTLNQTISTNVSNDSIGSDLIRLFGIVMGLSAALCAAFAFIVIRKLKGKTDPLHVIFYFHWVLVPLSLFFGPFMPSWIDSSPWIIPKLASTWALVLTATILGTLGQIFLTKALQTETAGKAASMNYIQVIFAFTLEWLFWGAVPSALSLFGAALIMGSLICATIYKNTIH